MKRQQRIFCYLMVAPALLFTIAADHVRKRSERRAIYLLVVVCGMYFVHNGLWMVRPPVADLAPTRFAGEVPRYVRSKL